jgi:hypothetical protein
MNMSTTYEAVLTIGRTVLNLWAHHHMVVAIFSIKGKNEDIRRTLNLMLLHEWQP